MKQWQCWLQKEKNSENNVRTVVQEKSNKALAKISNPYYSAILKAIDEIAENPRPFGYKKLTGRSGYRIRVGAYRVIYDIFDEVLVVEIVNIGSRGNIYED